MPEPTAKPTMTLEQMLQTGHVWGHDGTVFLEVSEQGNRAVEKLVPESPETVKNPLAVLMGLPIVVVADLEEPLGWRLILQPRRTFEDYKAGRQPEQIVLQTGIGFAIARGGQ